MITELFKFLPEPIGSRADFFIEGAQMTLILTLSAGLLGLPFGLFAATGKLSRNVFFRFGASFYIWIIRGTPLLVQILFVYYALPALFPVFKFSEFTAAVLALSLNVGAYNAEVIRAGILSVPKGQVEAALSLRLSKIRTWVHVVLPQALRTVTPPLVNNLAALLKDSSLASSIGLLELTLVGNRVSSETFLPSPVLITVAAVYLLQTTLFTGMIALLERGLKRRVKMGRDAAYAGQS